MADTIGETMANVRYMRQQAEQLKHQNELGRRKLEELDLLDELAKKLQEMQAPVPTTRDMGTVADPNNLAPGQAELSQVPTATRPSLTGVPAYDAMIGPLVKGGHLKEVASMINPLEQTKREILMGGSPVSMPQTAPQVPLPGPQDPSQGETFFRQRPSLNLQPTAQANTQPAGMDQLQGVIEAGGRGDTAALSSAAKLKTLTGIDLFPAIERAQKAWKETTERVKFIGADGVEYSARVGADGKLQPNSIMKSAEESVKIADMVNPDGSKSPIAYRGRKALPIDQSGLAPQPGPAALPPGQRPVDIALPGVTDANADKVGKSLGKYVEGRSAGVPGGIITQNAPSADPIGMGDILGWINPQTGKHPTTRMATDKLAAQGYVPYKPLSSEIAARFSKSVQAVDALPELERWLFDARGNLDPMKWAQMKMGTGDGVKYHGLLLHALAAQIRNESGAAIQEFEVQNLAKQAAAEFMRGMTSSQGVMSGLQRLGMDLQGFINLSDPSGLHQGLIRKNPYKSSVGQPQIIEYGRDAKGSPLRKGR